jgi:hypothetical protein
MKGVRIKKLAWVRGTTEMGRRGGEGRKWKVGEGNGGVLGVIDEPM